jgi:hypothetical protein
MRGCSGGETGRRMEWAVVGEHRLGRTVEGNGALRLRQLGHRWTTVKDQHEVAAPRLVRSRSGRRLRCQ